MGPKSSQVASVSFVTDTDTDMPKHYNDIDVNDIERKAYYLLEACESLVTILDLIKSVEEDEDIAVELLIGHRNFGISNHPSTVHLLEQELAEILKFLNGKRNTWI